MSSVHGRQAEGVRIRHVRMDGGSHPVPSAKTKARLKVDAHVAVVRLRHAHHVRSATHVARHQMAPDLVPKAGGAEETGWWWWLVPFYFV